MKKLITILAFFALSLSFGQVIPVNALKIKGITSVQRDGLTINPGEFPIIYNTTAGEFQRWNGAAWVTWASDAVAGVSSVNGETGAVALDLSLTGTTLSLTGDATTVDLSGLGGGGGLNPTDIDTFAELDAIVADKSLANLNDAQTFSSNIDFAAGIDVTGDITTTGTIALSSVGPRITSLGNIRFDLDIDNNNISQFEFKNGTNQQIFSVDESGNVIVGRDVTGNLTATGSGTFGAGIDVTGKIGLDDGGSSVFIGLLAGASDDGVANQNVGIGAQSLQNNVSGIRNVSIGYQSSLNRTGGNQNLSIGSLSLRDNLTGNNNVGVGVQSLIDVSFGSDNVAIGNESGKFIADGVSRIDTANQSIFIGSNTKANADSETNQTVIGYNAIGNGSNTVTIGNSSVTDNYFTGNLHSTGQGTFGAGIDVTGGNINSPASLNINLDTNNDGVDSLKVVNGAGAAVLTINESGNLTTTGTIIGQVGSATVDASGFVGNLTTSDNTLQEIANAVDGLAGGASNQYEFASSSGNETLSDADINLASKKRAWITKTDNATITIDNSLTTGIPFMLESGSAADSLTVVADTGIDLYGEGSSLVLKGTNIYGLSVPKGRAVSAIKTGANEYRFDGVWNVVTEPDPMNTANLIHAFTPESLDAAVTTEGNAVTTWVDEKGNQNMTLTNVTLNINPSGRRQARFNGTSSYGILPDNGLTDFDTGVDTFTIVVHLGETAVIDGTINSLFLKGGIAAGTIQYGARFTTGAQRHFVGTTQIDDFTGAITANDIFVFRVTTSQLFTYINDVVTGVNAETIGTTDPDTYAFTVGAVNGGTQNFWDGDIEAIYIYAGDEVANLTTYYNYLNAFGD